MVDDRLSREDRWASGAAYEPYIGRWSRLVAREFLHWLGIPPLRHWLDVGCGTGALCQTILDSAAPGSVTGIDRSEEYAAFARRNVQDVRTRFGVADAEALPFASAGFDAVVSGLVLNFVPQPDRAVAELARAAKPGGVVAVYLWDYAGEMQMLRHFWNAAGAFDPAARSLDQGRRFPLCRPEPLERVFQGSGLGSVEVRPIDIATTFRDFDDFWMPFLGGQGPAPGYVRTLDDEQRNALRERLRCDLPIAPDGRIHLAARAWAVRGYR